MNSIPLYSYHDVANQLLLIARDEINRNIYNTIKKDRVPGEPLITTTSAVVFAIFSAFVGASSALLSHRVSWINHHSMAMPIIGATRITGGVLVLISVIFAGVVSAANNFAKNERERILHETDMSIREYVGRQLQHKDEFIALYSAVTREIIVIQGPTGQSGPSFISQIYPKGTPPAVFFDQWKQENAAGLLKDAQWTNLATLVSHIHDPTGDTGNNLPLPRCNFLAIFYRPT